MIRKYKVYQLLQQFIIHPAGPHACLSFILPVRYDTEQLQYKETPPKRMSFHDFMISWHMQRPLKKACISGTK